MDGKFSFLYALPIITNDTLKLQCTENQPILTFTYTGNDTNKHLGREAQ